MHPSERTYHLHLLGQVQGVGFRPFVWRLARAHGLCGWVNNTTDGVHVVFNAAPEQAKAFVRALLAEAPALSRITAHHLECIDKQEFAGFQIVHSAADAEPNLLLTPDFGLCADCRRELLDPSNRRRGYAFITCTNCGPRLSIVTGLPYDRERTTMAPFRQCPVCSREYGDPADRRYFSQTNSCATCGVTLQFEDNKGRIFAPPLETAVEWLLAGKILAVKGIGGYLLLCDATNAVPLNTLRARKQRPTKPFALLYRDGAQIRGDAVLGAEEEALLESPAAPILLLQRHSIPVSGLCHELVAPGLNQIGVMLPYAPLLDLLARGVGRPLVATSGNISGAPIIFDDASARRDLSTLADGILSHNRAIAIPQDDSVLRLSPLHRQPIVLRRSRGYAPTFWPPPSDAQRLHGEDTLKASAAPVQRLRVTAAPVQTLRVRRGRGAVLALGASLKSTFAWQHQDNTYVSQYLGDLESYDTQKAFEHTLQHFLRLFRFHPESLVVDKHPEYFSTQLGKRLAAEWNIPVQEIQHHKAHFAAVLAEHGYFTANKSSELPVLGIIWDGTGYGDDGQVWGGEFFRFDGVSIERVGHFEPFDFLLGDKMPREPRLSALSLANGLAEAQALLEAKFTPQEWALYRKMLDKGGLLRTTSVGRLFDGAASLLGLADRVSYEGEAAMLLEQAAARYFRQNGLSLLASVRSETPTGTAPTRRIIQTLLDAIQTGASKEAAAALFHAQLIHVIRAQAQQHDCRVLAFSGGVWQNALLTDLAIAHLAPTYKLLFHRQLSPNDEGVSLGQVALSFH